MDLSTNNLLGRQLELQLNDITNDFNQILKNRGFSDVIVTSFTVTYTAIVDGGDNPPDTTCKGNRCVP